MKILFTDRLHFFLFSLLLITSAIEEGLENTSAKIWKSIKRKKFFLIFLCSLIGALVFIFTAKGFIPSNNPGVAWIGALSCTFISIGVSIFRSRTI